MIDALSISAIVISGLTAIAGAIGAIHIKRMKSGCCESDCYDTLTRSKTSSPIQSPIETQPKEGNFLDLDDLHIKKTSNV
jgi:hypothetical protein